MYIAGIQTNCALYARVILLWSPKIQGFYDNCQVDTQQSFGLDIETLQINHLKNLEKSTIFVTALPLSVAAADFISMTMFYYLNKCINDFHR